MDTTRSLPDVEGLLRAARQKVTEFVAAPSGLDDFRSRVMEQADQLARLQSPGTDVGTEVPASVREVFDRIAAGELPRGAVLDADSEDPGARAAHEWLTPRLRILARAVDLVDAGMSESKAVAAATDEYREQRTGL
ncbi:hypothetical protein LX16_3034 [Stackebrandtia albiflava]|uniref:Uncharacterized protein n=1 Tax=Stackebrandtia albiflava TaxID=406432 RepID=A0A562V344_9ACTN|nr:hypothetical protein [Stackebrandtia albiflava]TWJ12278.1 hypothetical protein LX16_3034 [Stackebrandtia albiflava]